MLFRSFVEVVRTGWWANADRGSKTLNERIAQIVGERDGDLQEQMSSGARYKPVAKKVNPVLTMDPDSIVPDYRLIEIGEIKDLPVHPTSLETLKYTEQLMKERVSDIIAKIPVGFLTKSEVELLVGILFEYEGAIVFTDAERGAFSQHYYPDYVICTMPHVLWQTKPIQLPQAKREEVLRLMKEQMVAGKYGPSSASY